MSNCYENFSITRIFNFYSQFTDQNVCGPQSKKLRVRVPIHLLRIDLGYSLLDGRSGGDSHGYPSPASSLIFSVLALAEGL